MENVSITVTLADFDAHPTAAGLACTIDQRVQAVRKPRETYVHIEILVSQATMDAVRTRFPYFPRFPENRYCDGVRFLLYYKLCEQYPQLEQVIKAGFTNVQVAIAGLNHGGDAKNMESFIKRNFGPGTAMKEIMLCPQYAWDALKLAQIPTAWDQLRITVQKFCKSREEFDALFALSGRWDIGPIFTKGKQLLNSGYYTVQSLTQYLARVEMYQAIEPKEAIDLLADYVSMCKQLGITPDLNTNSLKREHDVCARQFTTVRYEGSAQTFTEAVNKYKYYEFAYGDLVAIVPACAQDVIEEGRRQRNCVGSYIRSIIDGNSKIFFVRKKSAPDTSYITAEVYHGQIGQFYTARNAPVLDKSALKFREAWERHIVACDVQQGAVLAERSA